MHAEQKSLVAMVDALGLTPELTGQVRAILEGLSTKAENEPCEFARAEFGQAFLRVTVRARIPSVARSADSGMIGKIPPPWYAGSMVDQS